jgi:hypothetical protein
MGPSYGALEGAYQSWKKGKDHDKQEASPSTSVIQVSHNWQGSCAICSGATGTPTPTAPSPKVLVVRVRHYMAHYQPSDASPA